MPNLEKLLDFADFDLEEDVVLLHPGSKPRDTELKLFVVVSIPKKNVDHGKLHVLKEKYGSPLEFHETKDGRLCLVLSCETARNLEETGRRADDLKRHVILLLDLTVVVVRCGYMTLCECIEQPLD